MKRLTDANDRSFRGDRFDKIYKRLAAYEDTGYTPEEITSYMAALNEGYSYLKKEIASLKAENERLVFLINKHPLKPIEDCKHYKECYSKAYDHTKPMGCLSCDKWELGELEAENGQD